MPEVNLDQQLLGKLRQAAKKKAREDKTATYLQWLDRLCGEYGFTYTSLKQRVEELEQLALSEAFAAEDCLWEKRLSESRVWGSVAEPDASVLDQTVPLPIHDGQVPWPHCFAGSSLFSVADGPRRTLAGPLFTIDEPKMLFQGEELRIADDETLLMGLIMVAGRFPCGRLVEFSLAELEHALGCPLPKLGIPIQYQAIERTLWRLTHCILTVTAHKFDGPILVFADAHRAPQHFRIRFNPAFANFYYPWLTIFDGI